MTISLATDLGTPVERPRAILGTLSSKYFGAEPRAPGHRRGPEIWMYDGASAFKLGVGNPKGYPTTWTPVPEGADALECIRTRLENFPGDGDWLVEPMNIPPGRYFPRMGRPHHQHPGDFPCPFGFDDVDFAHESASASLQIAMLADRLRTCFQVVGPSEPNFAAYGGEFRNIILLAATEVEAQWKGILRANHYDNGRGHERWNTHDYFKLEAALRLADWGIYFPEYPWLKPVFPFRGWAGANPTGSIPWYDAYNLVKHDRERYSSRATLIRSLEAVAAVVVVGVAQFGINFVRKATRWRDLFQVHSYPRWTIGDTHGRVYDDGAETASEPIDYPFPTS
jgi:hypothetical protein